MQTDRLCSWIVYLSFVKTKGTGWGINAVKYLAYMLIITRCSNKKILWFKVRGTCLNFSPLTTLLLNFLEVLCLRWISSEDCDHTTKYWNYVTGKLMHVGIWNSVAIIFSRCQLCTNIETFKAASYFSLCSCVLAWNC